MLKVATLPTTSQNIGSGSPLHLSNRERDDYYANVVLQFSPRWRIITCKHGMQWILQKRSVAPPNTGTWAGKSYATTRGGLMAACSGRGLLFEPTARLTIEPLPPHIRNYVFEHSRS